MSPDKGLSKVFDGLNSLEAHYLKNMYPYQHLQHAIKETQKIFAGAQKRYEASCANDCDEDWTLPEDIINDDYTDYENEDIENKRAEAKEVIKENPDLNNIDPSDYDK